jgi:hypothetical protein
VPRKGIPGSPTSQVIDAPRGAWENSPIAIHEPRGRLHVQEITTLIDRYIEMWNEGDPERRRALVAQVVTEDADYLDPLTAGSGPDGIDAMIAGAQGQFPGHRFVLVAGPDLHHDRVRFSWVLVPDGGEPVATGYDFATVAADGRLRSVTGFLEMAA